MTDTVVVLVNGFPQGTSNLESQVAGHAFNDSKPRIGLLINEQGHVLKPIEGPVRGTREVNFYKQIQSSDDPIIQELKSFVPAYYGTKKLPWNEEEVDYIVLSNATAEMKLPCVMDIKIGRQTWDPEAPPSKKENELKKYVECKKEFGFCIPGLQMYDVRTGTLTRHGKEFGKDLGRESTKEEIFLKHQIQVFKKFLGLDTGYGRPVLESFVERIRPILSWCQRQRHFLMYSSSLLLAYDASCLNSGGDTKPLCTLTMIDFAHVFPASGEPDTNYIAGVESLAKLLELLMNET
ncbi:hypothetical protein B566_EDAN002011 [Ephemera danica]|nr:hypothetical protein B566_EDAN002011 [Ephemera danica]